VVEANQAFADMLGYTLTEALALTAAQVIHPEDKAQRDADAGRLLGGQLPNLATERRLIAKDGSTIWARVRKSVRHQDGQMVVMVIIEDWTTQHEQVTRLEHAADHDELTGLLNRRGLWGPDRGSRPADPREGAGFDRRQWSQGHQRPARARRR